MRHKLDRAVSSPREIDRPLPVPSSRFRHSSGALLPLSIENIASRHHRGWIRFDRRNYDKFATSPRTRESLAQANVPMARWVAWHPAGDGRHSGLLYRHLSTLSAPINPTAGSIRSGASISRITRARSIGSASRPMTLPSPISRPAKAAITPIPPLPKTAGRRIRRHCGGRVSFLHVLPLRQRSGAPLPGRPAYRTG